MDEKKVSILKAAYSAHKNEILQRQRMDSIAGAGSIIFYLLSFRVISLYPPAAKILSSLTFKCASTIIFVIITDIIIYFMVKNYTRICELQQIIAKIDTSFGLFEKGAFLTGDSLYPEKWKNYGTRRAWSVITRVGAPLILGLMVIALVWVKQF